MKNIIPIFLFTFLFTVNLNGQIYKNTFMVGGDLSFEKSDYPNVSGDYNWRFTATTQVGYFVMNNLALGTFFYYQKYGSSFTGWGVSPFARYYVKKAFLQAGYGFGGSNVASGGSSFSSEIGYAFFLNDNVALEPAFYFRQNFYDGKTGSANYGFKMGFQIYLNR